MFYYKNANISNTVRMVHLIHRNNVNGIIEICSYGNQYLTSDLSIKVYKKRIIHVYKKKITKCHLHDVNKTLLTIRCFQNSKTHI